MHVCVKFMQLKSCYHSCRVLSFLSVISCVIQINRTPLIFHETYYAKGQEK